MLPPGLEFLLADPWLLAPLLELPPAVAAPLPLVALPLTAPPFGAASSEKLNSTVKIVMGVFIAL
jgi:hypothetical protein